MADDNQHGKKFQPPIANVEASLVGSYMLLVIAMGLGLFALGLFVFDRRAGAYLPVNIGILLFSLLFCVAISYAPWRRIGTRRLLINAIKAGRYFVIVEPSKVVLKTPSEDSEFFYKDFKFVGKDSAFLDNKRDWGSLVLAREKPGKLAPKQRASIVRPIQKGLVASGTYDGITAIPLIYFSKDQYEEITTSAQAYHAVARQSGPVEEAMWR